MRRLDNASPLQAALIAMLTAIAGAVVTLVVAFLPSSWAPLQQALIAGLGGAISVLVPAAFMLAHAIHHGKAGGLSEQQVTGLVRSELSRVLRAAGGDAGSSTGPGRVIPVRTARDPDPAA